MCWHLFDERIKITFFRFYFSGQQAYEEDICIIALVLLHIQCNKRISDLLFVYFSTLLLYKQVKQLICFLSFSSKLYLKHSVACVNLNKSTCNRVKRFEANFQTFQQISANSKTTPKGLHSNYTSYNKYIRRLYVELLCSIKFWNNKLCVGEICMLYVLSFLCCCWLFEKMRFKKIYSKLHVKITQ